MEEKNNENFTNEDQVEIKVESKKEKKQQKKDDNLKFKIEIDKLHFQIKDLKDQLLRTQADSINYKKRIDQERINDRKYAAANVINDLLVPIDQLTKVVQMQTDNELLKNFLIGFKMISDQFDQILQTEGVTEIKALDQQFDPNVHYAVEKINDKEKENGIVVEVLQKGYMYKERILRPAMVKVNEWSE